MPRYEWDQFDAEAEREGQARSAAPKRSGPVGRRSQRDNQARTSGDIKQTNRAIAPYIKAA